MSQAPSSTSAPFEADAFERCSAEPLAGAPGTSESVDEAAVFVGSVVHDLAAPLRAMHGYVELLGHALPADVSPEATALLESMQRLVGRLDSELQALRSAYERLASPPRLATAPIAELLDPVVAAFRSRGDAALDVSIDDSPVHCDVGALRQALTDVLDNAVVHGTALDVGVSLRAAPRGDGYAAIEIADRGPGICSTARARLLRGTVPRADGGHGTSLLVAARWIARMGGTVTVRSRRGEGTTVTFTLPTSARDGNASAREIESP